MTNEPWPVRAERILPLHGASFPEYYLLCTAGYRINIERSRFVKQAAREFQGLGWPEPTLEELDAALDRLVEAGLITVLSEADVQAEKERRAASPLPELDDAIDYKPGHIDFTERGYLLYRRLIQAICGDSHLEDVGSNLDTEARRFDIYAVNRERCLKLMDTIQGDGDAYTGAEETTFIGREGPTEIGAWRPNRFSIHATGYHGVLRYSSDAAEPAVAADGASPRR